MMEKERMWLWRNHGHCHNCAGSMVFCVWDSRGPTRVQMHLARYTGTVMVFGCETQERGPCAPVYQNREDEAVEM